MNNDVSWMVVLQLQSGVDDTAPEGMPVIAPESVRADRKEDVPICKVINLRKIWRPQDRGKRKMGREIHRLIIGLLCNATLRTMSCTTACELNRRGLTSQRKQLWVQYQPVPPLSSSLLTISILSLVRVALTTF